MYLSDIDWQDCHNGWIAIANSDQAVRDATFARNALTISGQSYEKGLGTYPLSQVVYRIDAQYDVFEAYAGLSDDSNTEGKPAQFLVFVDDILAYDSGPVVQGEPARFVQVPLIGADELRLVTQVAEDAGASFTTWADAKLLKALLKGDGVTYKSSAMDLDTLRRHRIAARLQDRRVAQAAAAEMNSLLKPAADAYYGRTSITVDEKANVLLMLNSDIGVSFGFGGNKHGLLSMIHRPVGEVILFDGSPAIETATGDLVVLSRDTEPEKIIVREIYDPSFNGGQEAEIWLRPTHDLPWRIWVTLSMFDGHPHLLVRIGVVTTGGESVDGLRFKVLQGVSSNLMLGSDIRYLTDFSRMRYSRVPDDGLLRREAIGLGKPLYLWSGRTNRGLVVSVADETMDPATFSLRVDQAQQRARLGLTTSGLRRSGVTNSEYSPYIYLEPTSTKTMSEALYNHRRFQSLRHPPIPMPDWVRYQWLSWYVYYMGISDGELRRQVDYIANNLGDLGPWHLIVDAGWYVSEGRDGADWRQVDEDKFPEGLRSFVDYAHSRGIRVVLYFSAPYLDSRIWQGDWLGLRNIIQNHPDWLIPLGEDDSRESYVYDFQHPGLRAYMADVMKDYFVKYDVDGIKIDGLGNAEGALLNPSHLDGFGLVERATGQTMEIYRFIYEQATLHKSQVYLESGWLTPLFANRYCHTFRYGDERPVFNSEYPFPGLVGHIDYAVLQKELIGQRPNMGAIIYNPEQPEINRWWMEAALALDAQLSISVDMPYLSRDELNAYRTRLVHYNPFKGSTKTSGVVNPEIMVTTRPGIAFLGLLNRTTALKQYVVQFSDYGLEPEDFYFAYDVERGTVRKERGALRTEVAPGSFRLFVLTNLPGVVWTNSSFSTNLDQGSLTIDISGPDSLEGEMLVYIPRMKAIYFDGKPLNRTRRAMLEPGSYSYNVVQGALRLRYEHSGTNRIRIEIE